jgi:hypothetical protein
MNIMMLDSAAHVKSGPVTESQPCCHTSFFQFIFKLTGGLVLLVFVVQFSHLHWLQLLGPQKYVCFWRTYQTIAWGKFNYGFICGLTFMGCIERLPLHIALFDQWRMSDLDSYPYLCCQTVYTRCKLSYTVLGPFYSIYKTHIAHLSLKLTLKREQHKIPLHVQKPFSHMHTWQTGNESNFWWGLKKFSVYQLVHQNLVPHASFRVL